MGYTVLRPLSVFSRGGSLLPSIYADACCVDAVIVSQAPILHGLCSLGMSCNAVMDSYCPTDPELFKVCCLKSQIASRGEKCTSKPPNQRYTTGDRE